MIMWTEKHRPDKIEAIIGNEETRIEIVEWMKSWLEGKSNKKCGGIFLGPSGIGKTTLAYALAKKFNLKIIEMNASDTRTEKKIKEIIKKYALQKTLDDLESERRFDLMVFLDEIDGLHGSSDRGGIKSLIEIAKKKQILLVLSANNLDNRKYKDIIKTFDVFHFNPLTPRQILMIIKNISRTENMVIPDSRLEKIASICKGDLRYAINIIQREPLNLKNIDIEIRNEVFNIDITIKKLLGKNENKKKILYETSATLDEIYKNLSEVTAKSDLDLFTRNTIFQRISRIDVFMSRTRKKKVMETV